MLYILFGPDQFRAREELQAIRATLDRDGNLAHNTLRLEGRSLSATELRNACHAASFFAEDRLVIVEGLQARLGGIRRRGRRGRPAGDGSQLDEIVEVLLDLPPSTTVVLLEEQAPVALLEALAGHATVREFPILRGAELRAWVGERARLRGASLTPAALERLLTLIDGYHLGEMAQEIDKLATYANGRAIDVGDIDELVGSSIQLQTWDLTDAVIDGRGERALAVLRAMDAKDFHPQVLMFMLTRQYRQLLLARTLQDQGLDQAQIGQRLGVSGYPLRKLGEQAARYSAERLQEAYRRLLGADVAVKTGVLDVQVALEMLVVDLAGLARPMRRAR